MPNPMEQKAKERRSREAKILFDIENMDIMLGSNGIDHLDQNSESSTYGQL